MDGRYGRIGAAFLLFCWTWLTACAGDSDSPARALREGFPEQAALLLEGSAVARRDDADGGYRLRRAGDEETTESAALTARFPRNGAQHVRFVLPGGASIGVREIGAHGDAEPTGAAVAYAREGGTSFWTRAEDGFEEWLHLGPGIARAEAVVAAWEVEGAELAPRGDAIEIRPTERGARLFVTAPVAYAASGRRVPVTLEARGQRIELSVDAAGEAVLVDPKWALAMPLLLGARSEHTATVLQDGKVLVVGGIGANDKAMAVAEIYDPETGLWKAAAPLGGARYGHTATLLPDGRVMVTGGFAFNWGSTGEIYDPVTNTWDVTAKMQTGRGRHTATLLQNGKVLVAGGVGPFEYLTSAEIYDFATDTWTPAAPMHISRFWHTATLLPDGRVLVWGAQGTDLFPGENVPYEIYDPGLDVWISTQKLEPTRQRHTATVLQSGKVLIAGGEINDVQLKTAQLFDPATQTRPFVSLMGNARAAHTATLLPNGKVLIAGGFAIANGNILGLNATELYDEIADKWLAGPMLNVARYEHTASLLQDTRVLVTGGQYPTLSSTEIYGTALGDSCGVETDCPSGFCVDGVCCDTACDAGVCDACSIALGASQDGTCELLTGIDCDDGNVCTTGDACKEGVCAPGPPRVCEVTDECHLPGTCDSQKGICPQLTKANGQPCTGGQCLNGVCVPTPDAGSGGGGGGGGGGAGGTGGAGGGPSFEGGRIRVQGGCVYGMAGAPRFAGLGWFSLTLGGLFVLRRTGGRGRWRPW